MQRRNTLGKAAILAGLTLGIALCVRMTAAQRQGGYSQGGYSQGGNQGRGQQRNASPSLTGTITGGNANAGTITVQTQNGSSSTVQVSNSTQFMTQTAISASAMKVGDNVQVKGLPTAITATSIIDGQLPTSTQVSAAQSGGSGRASGTGTGTAFASATGVITSLSPLTISIGGGVSLSVTGSSSTSVTKLVPLTYSQLKVGDTISVTGQATNNGTFTASAVGVNMGR